MADRASAEVFSRVFQLLHENLSESPTIDRRTLARRLYRMLPLYDFSRCQMGVDDELEALGLIRYDFESNRYEDTEEG